MARRDYAGAAVAAVLAADINATASVITLNASPGAGGWPVGTNGKFYVVLDRGKVGLEEKILVTSRSSLTLTLASSADRGQDGTSGVSHTAGATVEHCGTATDLDEANAFVNNPGLVAAITSSAVGDSAAAGVSGAWARADHKHGREALHAKFALTNSATQAIGDTTAVAVTYNTETSDTGSGHTNPGTSFVIPAGLDGAWLFTAEVAWPSNATGYRQLSFLANSVVRCPNTVPTITGITVYQSISGIVDGLTAGQVVQVTAYQTSGGSLTLPANSSFFSGFWLRS